MRVAQQRQQQAFQQIRKDVQADQTRIDGLVQQWNDLNEKDVRVIQSQQNILSALDTNLESIREGKRTVNVLGRKYQELELYEQALVRLISEIEEEKWPYYLDQLVGNAGTNSGPTPIVAEDSSKNVNPKKASPKNVVSKAEDQPLGELKVKRVPRNKSLKGRILRPFERDYRFFRRKIGKMKKTVGRFIEQFDPDIEDIYGIQALEDQLDSLHSRRQRTKALNKMGNAPEFFVDDPSTNSQIRALTKQLEEKREQRSQDVAKILDKEYRNSLSEEELTYAQKIIENQVGELQFGLGRPGKDNFVSNVAAFFSPHTETISGLEQIYKELESRKVKKKQEANRQMRAERDKRYRESFRLRRKQLEEAEQNNTAQNTERLTTIANKEGIQMDYLRTLLHSQDHISSLKNWKHRRTSIDKQRQELEENKFFQTVKPYLSRQEGSPNLIAGTRVRHFFELKNWQDKMKFY